MIVWLIWVTDGYICLLLCGLGNCGCLVVCVSGFVTPFGCGLIKGCYFLVLRVWLVGYCVAGFVICCLFWVLVGYFRFV